MACILHNISIYRRSENMSQVIGLFWLVVIFWLVIEVINSKINKNRKFIKMTDEFNNEK